MPTLAITVHALAATAMLLLPLVQLLRRPKDRAHRWIGRSWVLCAWTVCVSGMFIYTLSGGFTIFHALAIFTFFTTTLGVIHIRRGRIRSHVQAMLGSWIGAMVAGGFAMFVPSREIPRLAVSDPVLLWSAAAGVALVCTLWVLAVLHFVRRPAPVPAQA